jgi:hypothetical protein
MLYITCLCRHEIVRGNSQTPSNSLWNWTAVTEIDRITYSDRISNLIALGDVQCSLGPAVFQAVEHRLLTLDALGSVTRQPVWDLWRTEWYWGRFFSPEFWFYSSNRRFTEAPSMNVPEMCDRLGQLARWHNLGLQLDLPMIRRWLEPG